MKQLVKDLLISAGLGFLLPGMFLNYGARVQQRIQEPVQTEISVSVPVRVRSPEGTVTEGALEEYLVGVVLAELPALAEAVNVVPPVFCSQSDPLRISI